MYCVKEKEVQDRASLARSLRRPEISRKTVLCKTLVFGRAVEFELSDLGGGT